MPLGWRCSPLYFAAGAADGCDCNCGLPDPDCAHLLATRFCHAAGRSWQVQDCAQCSGGSF